MTTINHHLAAQMRLAHIDRDGKCFLQTAAGEVEFDLLGDSQQSKMQRALGFTTWAQANGLPTNPQACAIATGYIS